MKASYRMTIITLVDEKGLVAEPPAGDIKTWKTFKEQFGKTDHILLDVESEWAARGVLNPKRVPFRHITE